MDPDFWHRRWQKNEIGFHESEGSYLLKNFLNKLALPNEAKLFVPLCGKTRDIAWLLNRGVEVLANELNESAVVALFAELDIEPKIEAKDVFVRYSAPNLSVLVGDFFDLQRSDIGAIDGIYDRAALVALPKNLREKYTQHLRKITGCSQQLLVTFDYEQSLFSGPPFSVNESEVTQHYARDYQITKLHRNIVEGGFRGHNEVYDEAYLLNCS